MILNVLNLVKHVCKFMSGYLFKVVSVTPGLTNLPDYSHGTRKPSKDKTSEHNNNQEFKTK